MLPVQCKMARVATGLGVRELAELAKVSPDTVARLERGEPLKVRTVDAIRQALEGAGVEFTNGGQPGVRLTSEKSDSELLANFIERGPCLIWVDGGCVSAGTLREALAIVAEAVAKGKAVTTIDVLGQVKILPQQIGRLSSAVF